MAKKKRAASSIEQDDDSKIFPQRLMEVLCDESNSEAIAWLPHGRAFIIRNRKVFEEKVMPRFFPRKAKYSSFTRKLNRWNFVRVSSGPELGAYYHEFFLRDKPHLAAQMFCKNTRSKLAMANEVLKSSLEQPQMRQPQMAAPPQHPFPPPPPPQQQQMPPALYAAAFAKAPPQNDIRVAKNPLLPVGYGSNLQMLERQMQIMQQEQAHRHMMEQVAVNRRMMPPPTTATTPDQRLMQIQMLMNHRMRQRQAARPTNSRASAA